MQTRLVFLILECHTAICVLANDEQVSPEKLSLSICQCPWYKFHHQGHLLVMVWALLERDEVDTQNQLF